MEHDIELNEAGFEYAKKLIEDGQVVLDQGDWGEVNPDTEQQDQFIEEDGMEAYSLWHLGTRPEYDRETKQCWAFPYGDFEKVHRSGLMAAEERARQYDYEDIRAAAVELLEMLPDPPALA